MRKESLFSTFFSYHILLRIILENSGVAEPQNIRDKFAEALASGHPVMDRIELDTLVTVLDSATFIADYASR
jgi:G3E family GTPase